MAVKLTKTVVDGSGPHEKDYIVWDSEIKGFGLKVTPTGNKTYILFYRSAAGRQRKPTIGKHGAITVSQAREKAKEWLYEIANGVDVSAERKSYRNSETIADLAERYLIEYAEVHKKPRSIETDRANIQNHVIPLIGKLKVADVKRADIDRIKLDIRDGKSARKLPAKPRGRRIVRGGKGIANRVLALLSKMFSCAVDWGLRTDNPALGIKKFKEQRKDRFLAADEIERLQIALDEAENGNTEFPSAIAGIRLLLFTGLRLGEVRGLEWRDVDLERGILQLRDSKTGARRVPINSVVIDLLKKHFERGGGDLVLEGTIENKPISLTRPWYRIRQSARIDESANLHCLRHTFASVGVMDGLTLSQVGNLLGHKSAQTTMRYADHAMEAQRGYSEKTADALKSATSKTRLDR